MALASVKIRLIWTKSTVIQRLDEIKMYILTIYLLSVIVYRYFIANKRSIRSRVPSIINATQINNIAFAYILYFDYFETGNITN